MGQCVGVWDVCQVGGGSAMSEHVHWSLSINHDESLYTDDILAFEDGRIWIGVRLHEIRLNQLQLEADGLQASFQLTDDGLVQVTNWDHLRPR